MPGYAIDTCATGQTLIRVNPLLARDELGLIASYGLRYIEPDPVAHAAFPDGEQFTMWLDADRTAAEIARFSPRDAVAYRRLLADYDEVKSIFSMSQFTPVGFGPSLDTDEVILARRAGTPPWSCSPISVTTRRRSWPRHRGIATSVGRNAVNHMGTTVAGLAGLETPDGDRLMVSPGD